MSHAQLTRSSSECKRYSNIYRYAICRAIGGTRTYMGPYIDQYGLAGAKASFKSRNFRLYKGYSLPHSILQMVPKIFSSEWIDECRIAIGCKDGSLHVVDISSVPWTIRSIGAHPDQIPLEGRTGTLVMRKNKHLDLMASSSADGTHIRLWDAQSMKERCKMTGPEEFIFDGDWLDDCNFVTVGLKGERCLWRLDLDSLSSGVSRPAHRVREPNLDDYRCVRALSPLSKFVAISQRCHFTLIDSTTFLPVYTFLGEDVQTRCCAWSHERTSILVGNSESVSAFDPRAERMQFVTTFREHRCVRSISIHGNRITMTTSSGKVAFMDFRMPKILPLTMKADPVPSPQPWIHRSEYHYQVLGGYVAPTELYMDVFNPLPIEQALFTHTYDSSGMKLFIAGGPSLAGLNGSTAGILH